MNIILFDTEQRRKALLPLTYTRPISEIRMGIMTINEKWRRITGFSTSYLTESYLRIKYGLILDNDNLFINSGVFPNKHLIEIIKKLPSDSSLGAQDDELIAYRCGKDAAQEFVKTGKCNHYHHLDYHAPLKWLNSLWDIFLNNSSEIENDFRLLTRKKENQHLYDSYTKLYQKENIFIEEGAQVRASILNASNGPIYIGEDALISENSVVIGPFAMCKGAQVCIGGKMREGTTLGPYSKVGGEIKDSVFIGYGNKVHDGFLGNTIIGEWCNIGAGTNTSNLKNSYGKVKVWHYSKNAFVNSNERFCGTFMGDHSKIGINTTLNAGTVIGVAANIFGHGTPPKFIPSFAWGGANGFETNRLDKVCKVASYVIERRGRRFDNMEQNIVANVYKASAGYRSWET